jgi:hypothetical protein
LQLGDETAKETPVVSRNHVVHGFLRAIWSGEKLYYTQQNGTLTGGLTMRVIQRGAASLGEGVLRDFARSLQTADLALATRRGYAADLGRFAAFLCKRDNMSGGGGRLNDFQVKVVPIFELAQKVRREKRAGWVREGLTQAFLNFGIRIG